MFGLVFTTSQTALPDFDVGSMETSAIGTLPLFGPLSVAVMVGKKPEAADAAVAGVFTVDQLGQTDIRGRWTYCPCCRRLAANRRSEARGHREGVVVDVRRWTRRRARRTECY